MALANKAEQHRAKQLAAINQINRHITAILDLDRLFAEVVDLIRQTFGYDHVSIFTVEPDTQEVISRATTSPTKPRTERGTPFAPGGEDPTGDARGSQRMAGQTPEAPPLTRDGVPASDETGAIAGSETGASNTLAIQEQSIEAAMGHGIVGWVAQHGEPILANDVSQEPRFRSEEALPDTRAELAVPLMALSPSPSTFVARDERLRHESSPLRSEADSPAIGLVGLKAGTCPRGAEHRIVGVLDVQSNRLDAFTEDDVLILQTIAAQAAIAIKNAKLYAARQEEAWSSTALLQVAEAVGSLTSLDDILKTTVRITPMLVGVDRCTILLWEEDSQEFVAAQSHAHEQAPPLFDTLRFQPGDMLLLDQLRNDGIPIIVDGSEDTPLIPPSVMQGFQIGILLALPLRAQGEILGAMLVDYVNAQAPFPTSRRLAQRLERSERQKAAQELVRKKTILAGIADQAAMAIANARWHDAQREEAWVSTALLQVAQAFASSTDLHENIAKIARLTPLLAGVDRCMIFLWNKNRGEFVPTEAHGLSKEALQVFCDLRFKPGDVPLLDEVARRQSYIVVENTAESDLIPQSLLRSFEIKSVLGVPLVSKGETLGAFLVDCTEYQSRFPIRKISIVEGIAHQTAAAIERARLYEALFEQERMTQELRLAREIQVSFLPDTCPLVPGWEIAADWLAAREVGGDFYDFIPLGKDRLGLVIADVSDKGVPAALFMSLSRILLRASALEIRSPAKVLERVNRLIMTETRSDMFVTMFYGVLNWHTGQLSYASAGHNPPIWWQRAKSRMSPLAAKGIVLGIAEDASLEERQVSLKPGDIVVLYTDGVTEPINEEEEEFGEQRLEQAIADGSSKPCNELVRLIRDAVSAFVGDQPRFDDYTLLAIKRQEQS